MSEQTIEFPGNPTYRKPDRSDWNDRIWECWHRLNMSTANAVRPNKNLSEFCRFRENELEHDYPGGKLLGYVRDAFKAGSEFKSQAVLQVERQSSVAEVPKRIQTLVETLMLLPFSEVEVLGSLKAALRLGLAIGDNQQDAAFGHFDTILDQGLGTSEKWKSIDCISNMETTGRIMLPLDHLVERGSVQEALRVFKENELFSDAYKDFAKGKPAEVLYCMLFHQPPFRHVFSPTDALYMWVNYAIPWQVCTRKPGSCILNPFQVRFFGLS